MYGWAVCQVSIFLPQQRLSQPDLVTHTAIYVLQDLSKIVSRQTNQVLLSYIQLISSTSYLLVSFSFGGVPVYLCKSVDKIITALQGSFSSRL